MLYRKLEKNEWTEAMALCWRTFLKFDSPDYEPEGVKAFYRFVVDTDLEKMFLLGEYKAFGAFDDDKIVGFIGMRNGNFLSLLFVDETYHHRGIGTNLVGMLVEYLKAQHKKNSLIVYSSPYAVDFYHHIGFCDTGAKTKENGMYYTPMELML